MGRAVPAGCRMLHAGLCAVSAVALVAVGAPTAEAGARGCNGPTCISVVGSGLRVETISASTTWNGDSTGHIHIWGGGTDRDSATGFWGYHQEFTGPVHRDLANRAVLCAEGWEHTGGGLQSRGSACADARF
ncbi:hypothetical protein [Streptodolium elevatio]|uniref:Secreted protein n=1 Tax=Streptodolium elevatio TaxID=3157996 RepID=A0ABV3DTX0_9ACTN